MIWLALLLSIVFQSVVTYAAYLLLLRLDIAISFLQFLLSISIVSIIQILPISISGIGVRESVLLVLLATYGVKAEQAVSLSLLILAINVSLSLMGYIAEISWTNQETKLVN